MSFHDTLVQHTQSAAATLQSAAIIQNTLRGEITRAEYVAFLTEAYHHVKHTVPLLMAAGARLPEDKEWLREAVAEYISEEVGHQEWILNDLAACGVDKEAVRHGRPALATELMVAYAYDTIQRGNPLGFFGMVHVLEGTSIAIADRAADAIAEATGLPRKAFTYLRSHGGLDVEHVKFFKGLMDRISDPAEQDVILHAAGVFFRLYGDIFRSLPALAASSTAKKVAA
ncbi:TenA family transcriptional regulator [Perlucidibaca piscinae]|uniref:TenA family transcriptional regulator n=1 Tax=Perlucidibaca piscinae TaxID=392589 RepID=UPI0003B64313|nr:iron-containing redox enzyme family protein [Perlucidibaca piscinae]